jgi:hypothetical protein
MNEDVLTIVSVASNETAVIKGGLMDLSKSPIKNIPAVNSFQICLDGAYRPLRFMQRTTTDNQYT